MMPLKPEQNDALERAMNSLQGLKRPPADPAMYDKVIQRLATETTSKSSKVRWLTPRIAAAAAVLLLVVNVASVVHVARKHRATATSVTVTQAISDDINSLSDANF